MAHGRQLQRSWSEDGGDHGGDIAPGRRTLTMAMPGRASAPPIQLQVDLGASLREAAPPSRFPADDPFGMHLIGEHLPAAGDGEALPAPVQAKMERSFGTDLSDVRVHQDGRAEAMGARAFAQGTDLHFSAGQYDPSSAGGQELLGHELAHVVQQRAGVVSGTQAKGGHPINADAALEDEADREGAKAARGETATIAGASPGGGGRMRGDAHAIQGVWWVLRDLGVGIVEGIGREAAAQVTREQLGRVIADAAPGLLAALDVAMQNPELRQLLGNLRVLHNVGDAARALAAQHARQMAEELAAWLRQQLPDLPEELIPEAVRDLQERIEARMRNSYAAEAMRAIADVGGQMAAAAASAHLGQVIDRQLVRVATDQVSSAARAAVQPVMDAAGGAVQTAQQVQEVIRDAELPIPAFRPIRRFGRAIGRHIEHAVTGTSDATSQIDGSVLDPLRTTASAATEQAQQTAASAVTAPSAIDPMTVLRIAQATSRFAQAERTADRINAVAEPLVDTGMGMLGGMMLTAPLTAMLPVAAAPLAPAMAAAGGIALGQRYVMPAVRSAAETASPYLESFGQTTVGTPFRKAAQGVHTLASFANLGMTTLMAPLPIIGGGWAGINAAAASTDASVNALLGRSPTDVPSAEPAPHPIAQEEAPPPAAAFEEPAAEVEEPVAEVEEPAAASSSPVPMRPFMHPSLRGLYGMNPLMMGMGRPLGMPMGMGMGLRRPAFNPLMMPMYNPIITQATLARMGIQLPGMPELVPPQPLAEQPLAEQPADAPALADAQPAPVDAQPAPTEEELQARLAALMAPPQREAQPQLEAAPPPAADPEMEALELRLAALNAPAAADPETLALEARLARLQAPAEPQAEADPEMDELELRLARLNAPATTDPETLALEARLARLRAPAAAEEEREAPRIAGDIPDPELLQAQLDAPETDDPEIAALEARLGALNGPAPTEDELELRLANLNAPPVTDPEIMALEERLLRLQMSPAEAAEMDELEARLARLNAATPARQAAPRERVAITVPRD